MKLDFCARTQITSYASLRCSAMLLAPLAASAQQQQQHYLYRTELIQATPGRIGRANRPVQTEIGFVLDQQAGDEPALWMRQ